MKDYTHQDRMGSTTNLTDQFGRVVGRADYNEWGQITYKDALDITSSYRRIYPQLSYTGHDWDDVLGMYYAKARFYDADTKRFLAIDPVKGNITDPLSLVPYIYCVDNPLRYTDPLGMKSYKVNGTAEFRPSPVVPGSDKLRSGQIVTDCGASPIYAQGGYWRKVSVSANKTGWVNTKYLDEIKGGYNPGSTYLTGGNSSTSTAANNAYLGGPTSGSGKTTTNTIIPSTEKPVAPTSTFGSNSTYLTGGNSSAFTTANNAYLGGPTSGWPLKEVTQKPEAPQKPETKPTTFAAYLTGTNTASPAPQNPYLVEQNLNLKNPDGTYRNPDDPNGINSKYGNDRFVGFGIDFRNLANHAEGIAREL